jgi:hypothetical protein
MTMSVTQALVTARRRVTIARQGDRYVVKTYWPQRNKVRRSPPLNYQAVRWEAYDAKVRIALKLLGVERADRRVNQWWQDRSDAAHFNDVFRPLPDWRRIVRCFAREPV